MTEEKDQKDILEEQNDTLEHYGIPRKSGRYPWGSGKVPFQRTGDFLARIDELKKEGLRETEISTALGFDSTTEFRVKARMARNAHRAESVATAKRLEKEGLNRVEIGRRMGGLNESSVRSLLNADSEARMIIAEKTANKLRDIVDDKKVVDIGVGVERKLNISREKLDEAVAILKLEGYEVHGSRVPQATNKDRKTTLKLLCSPGTPAKAAYDFDNIHSIDDVISRDRGETFEPAFVYPKSLDSNRIQVRYREDGGDKKDGVIELRRGVEDISLGNSHYSQVRVLVDDEYYLKGMAVYSDDMPPGVDVIFNTNKEKQKSKHETFKKIKNDPDNPFGSSIKEHGGQSYYIDENGEKQLRVINKRADEGDWGMWSKELSSQFLSKQPIHLIKKQLDLSLSDKQDEFDEIMALTNPTIKKALLSSFADNMDSASVHLKAASLPGQTYKVILPINSLKDNEIYAPHLKDGSEVALVRYPHGGIFEIPIVKVNNRNKEAKDVLTANPSDAVGINKQVADVLSGADFDGDTVMVIPLSDRVKINSEPPLKQLKDFDTILNYGPDEIQIINGEERYFRGNRQFPTMKETSIQTQMGIISNLITDMTLKGATQDELARAVKHSMVVIDAHKHNLDYKRSEAENGIRALHKKYQSQVDETTGREHGGASTLISKSKSEIDVPERKEGAFVAKDTGNTLVLIDPEKKLYFDEKTNRVYGEKEKKTLYVDPETGAKLYRETGRTYDKVKYTGSDGKEKTGSTLVKDGKLYYKDDTGNYVQVTSEKVITKPAMSKVTRMEDTPDARTLSSGTVQEEAYATYANKLKSLANQARKEVMIIEDIPYSPSARASYKDQVDSLDYKLNQALLNAPKERHAQVLAASIIKAKKQAEPTMTSEQVKKLSQQELTRARAKVGAKRSEVKITPEEWEAVQAGAISKTKLEQIINNADLDILRQLAMPRTTLELSPNKIRRMKNMASSGYTTNEIADSLGVSPATITKYLKGDE